MRCSVLTAVAVLCLTAHLPTGTGHIQGQLHPQGTDAAPPKNITFQEDINAALKGGGDLKAKEIATEPQLEDGRVPVTVGQLVICSCGGLTPDDCRRSLSDTTIDSKNDLYEDIRRPVGELNLVVHNVTCQKKDHRLMYFNEGQYYYRHRGDLVLRDAGDLTGLRVNDFCANLHPDKYGDMKWNVKICVAPPSVPRCCPKGQALTDGVCKDAITPAILEPPLAASLQGKPIYWPVIENHYHPLNCTEHPLKSIPLVPDESTLLSVYYGIMHIWKPSDGHVLKKYTYPPDLCIDGHVDSYGSVVYSANICYSDPEEFHDRTCDGHICVRKCCQDDEEMNMALYRCTPSNRTNYQPHFTSPPHDYRIVNGKPLCPYHEVVQDATLSNKGNLNFAGESLSTKDYCVDKFNDGLGNIEDKAMVCLRTQTKPWAKVRKQALLTCQIISVLFLMLTVGCYCLVPQLLQDSGWCHLFHALSLMLGYVSILAQQMFSKTWDWTTCFAMGVVLQFAFLATFFWLNVMCFEIWRKIRSLKLYQPASLVPVWIYMLYAFGVPIAIGTLTVCMQLFAPDSVPGIVKPNLAHTRCFFDDTVTLYLYFYGPIALLLALNLVFITLTCWTYRKLEKNASILKKHRPEKTCVEEVPMERVQRDYISDFKQQFSLLVLMSFCWVTEVLSSLIPPLEMWIVADLLNALQGVFVFCFFVANRSKRKHLKQTFRQPFKIAHHLQIGVQQCCCQGGKKA